MKETKDERDTIQDWILCYQDVIGITGKLECSLRIRCL